MEIPDSTRYEIKMTAEDLMLPVVRSWLTVHPTGFYQHFPPRQVNNIYFDTPHLYSYAENLSGGASRSKVRLRWYGESTTNVQAVFEIKRKRNMLGWKVSQKLKNLLVFQDTKWIDIISGIRVELSDANRVILDRSGSPVFINRYQREYYVSFDDIIRVTLDYDQKVYDQRFSAFPNLSSPLRSSKDMVIEFKVDSNHRERLVDVINGIHLRVCKYSKFVFGVESLLGH